MIPSEEDRQAILDGYEVGAEGLRDMMTVSFSTLLVSLMVAAIVVWIGWAWIEGRKER